MRFLTLATGCRLLTVLLALCLTPLPSAVAQERPGLAPVVDAAVLKRKIEEVEATDSLDEATAGKLVELYRKALTNLEQARSNTADADAYAAAAKSAPAETTRLQQLLDKRQQTAVDVPSIPEDMSIPEIEQSLTKEEADLAAVEAKLTDLRKRHDAEVDRPAIARERLIQARQEQDAAAAEIKAPAPADESAAVTEARRWFLDTRTLALSAEIRKLDQELLSHQERLDLLEAQRAEAQWSVAFVSARVRALNETLGNRRREEAEQAQQKAAAVRDELEGEHPAVRELAQQNATLSDTLAALAADLEAVSAEDDRVRKEATRIEDALSSTKNKLAIAGLSQALGHVLLEQRRSLPDLAAMRTQAKARQRQIAETALRLFHLGEERRALRDLGNYAAERTPDMTPAEADQLRPAVRELADSRRDLVRTATDSGAAYLRALNDLDLAQHRLKDAVEIYDEFLGKRLLWMRSVAPIEPDVVRSVPEDLARLLSPSSGAQLARDFLAGLRHSRSTAAALAVLVVLVFLRRRFLASLTATAEKIWGARDDQLKHTLNALALTALAAAPAPLLLFAAGRAITMGPEPAMFSTAIAKALTVAALTYLVVALFLGICRENGVAARHFRWPATAVSKLRRELGWLIVVLPTARFIGLSSASLDTAGVPGGLTVLGLLTAGGSLGVFVFRLFTPEGGVLHIFLTRHSGSLLARLRPVWVGAVSAVIPVLIGFWVAGYTYTGTTVAVHYMDSLWLVGGLVVLHALAIRWLLLVRRRLQFQAAKERLETARAAREAAQDADGGESPAAEGAVEIEEPEVDFAALDADSRKLLRTVVLFLGVIGYWLIWSEAIPALGILEDVALWNYTTLVNGVETQVSVTIADLLLAIIVAITTFAAARGLPSIIEFVLLQRTSVTAGGRYTAVTLLRYAIFTTGTVIVFGMLGGSWSQIQWLVAALSVGIGFGLQEIVANFISGLIILFERPIRIGDTITVGDTSGVVSRIEIRATTIMDWDRKELVVPNKEFVTGRLLNWTLSDPVTRLVIPVGIAYGSDVAKAMMLLKETADEHDNVVEDPGPFVTFEGFGDNALDLLLRAYVPSLENRLRTISDLHETINTKFNEAGIVVAFPQRDIHVDTSGPLDIRLHPGDSEHA